MRISKKNFANATKLRNLSENFRNLVKGLEALGVAHGDLQHGNILASDSSICLVDYDGMFVPGMALSASAENGHVNYQSPKRNEHSVGPYLDRFSSIVIALALEALIRDPTLWNKYSGSENILFRRTDFDHPNTSPLLIDLSKLPGMSQHVSTFRSICNAPLDQIPRLEDFFGGTQNIPNWALSTSTPASNFRIRQFDVLKSGDRDAILHRLGDKVEIVGVVTAVKRSFTRHSLPYVFINFGDYRSKSFTIVLWSEAVKEFDKANINVDAFVGAWVSVTGIIQEFRSAPQIQVDRPGEIVLLSGQSEAERLFNVLSARQLRNQSLKGVFTGHEFGSLGQTTSAGKPVHSAAGTQSIKSIKSSGVNEQLREKINHLSCPTQTTATSSPAVHSGKKVPQSAVTTWPSASNSVKPISKPPTPVSPSQIPVAKPRISEHTARLVLVAVGLLFLVALLAAL